MLYVLTIQSPSSGCSSCLFLCVIWGSNGSQVLQKFKIKWNYATVTQTVSSQYLIQKAKLGVLLLWVFTSRIRSFFHQKNIPLFTLGTKNKYVHKIKLIKDCIFSLKKNLKSLVCLRILPLFSQCCWAKWPSPVSDELSCTPSTCQWMVWYPAERY